MMVAATAIHIMNTDTDFIKIIQARRVHIQRNDDFQVPSKAMICKRESQRVQQCIIKYNR
jgi:hypothetical protein